jgi:hypothetical protein
LRKTAQNVVGTAIHESRRSQLHDGRSQFALPWPQDLFHAEIAQRAADLSQKVHVCVDSGCVLRELPDEVVAKCLFAGHRIEDPVTDIEAIVFVRHRCPLQLAAGEEVEHLARSGLRAYVADVVHTDVPFVPVTLVGMGIAAGGVMLFEDAHAPAEFGKQCRGRQPPHTRAYDDRVIGLRKTIGAVAIADT